MAKTKSSGVSSTPRYHEAILPMMRAGESTPLSLDDFPDFSDQHIQYGDGANYREVPTDEAAQYIERNWGVPIHADGDADDATKMVDAAKSFTGTNYMYIRKAQKNGETDSKFGKQAQQVESLIDAAVNGGDGWSGGPIYRGINLDSSTVQAIMNAPVGEKLDINGGAIASWSTRINTASYFAGGKNEQVIFVNVSGRSHGVSVELISEHRREDEVICSSKNVYRKVGVGRIEEYNDPYTVVYVTED